MNLFHWWVFSTIFGTMVGILLGPLAMVWRDSIPRCKCGHLRTWHFLRSRCNHFAEVGRFFCGCVEFRVEGK